MAIVEEVDDEPETPQISLLELTKTINALSAKLALPEELLPSFMTDDSLLTESYQDKAIKELEAVRAAAQGGTLQKVGESNLVLLFGTVSRLYGDDSWTSQNIRDLIDEIAASSDAPALSINILKTVLRPLFASHPMISSTSSRALTRPSGGPEAMSDMQDSSSQPFKLPSAWGCDNMLRWCSAQLPTQQIVDNIGLILPPTLTMMDDWEPGWRKRGVSCLDTWIDKIPSETLKRMGLDRLLLNSMIHTLSLHSVPPLPEVLPVTLKLVGRTLQGEKKSDRLAEIMDKAVLSGWMYAKSGEEGRVQQIQIAKNLELLCDVLGSGIVRWLKSIIPNLLQPLEFTLTPAVLPHFEANLRALLQIAKTVAPTGRLSRWRGQIISVLAQVAVQVDERDAEINSFGQGDNTADGYADLIALIKIILLIISDIQREVITEEFARLKTMDHAVFRGILSVE